jgi:hypothetical protein
METNLKGILKDIQRELYLACGPLCAPDDLIECRVPTGRLPFEINDISFRRFGAKLTFLKVSSDKMSDDFKFDAKPSTATKVCKLCLAMFFFQSLAGPPQPKAEVSRCTTSS